jgi:membrane protein DedA with SNARE-associated domain
MRAQRIMAGFLHLGTGLAVICWVPGFFYLAVCLAGVPSDGLVAATTIRHGILLGAVSCVTSTILRWIVANLAGDA